MYISLQSHYAETKIRQAKKPMKSMKQAVSNISTGFLLISNKPIKIFQLKKLVNQSLFNGAFMIEMISNSFYESKNNFLIKKDIRTMKRMVFSENFKKFLVSECIFKLACFVRVAGNQGYVSRKVFTEIFLSRLVLVWLIFTFFQLQYMKQIQLQRCIQNPFRHIENSFSKIVNGLRKNSIIDNWYASEYASQLYSYSI